MTLTTLPKIDAQPTSHIAVTALSKLDQSDFVLKLEGIFEHSPWVAARAWADRPFHNRSDLERALQSAMWCASRDELLDLIRAHPELAGKAAASGQLTKESTHEQAGAGLNACTPEQLIKIQQLNAAYMEKFGWPFIVAVRGMNVDAIIAAIQTRLDHTAEQEFEQALQQISRIASLRLDGLLIDA
ncbi:2-oxo-4-hydroxy-4-carboxy-5-ureidoimidazoline decarboxylase [Aquirhabdus sp.]|uniref:2-oxo-4-hydroxy-4-carboxy-5-ureidoimidazoline decarboxylase n=1 Tax=Aquirhabdus sp. TaxID=2824160 RepID=UPI00396C58D5